MVCRWQCEHPLDVVVRDSRSHLVYMLYRHPLERHGSGHDVVRAGSGGQLKLGVDILYGNTRVSENSFQEPVNIDSMNSWDMSH